MAPEVKENPVFSHWFEEWVTRIHSSEHADEASQEGPGRKDDERRRQAEKEPILKH